MSQTSARWPCSRSWPRSTPNASVPIGRRGSGQPANLNVGDCFRYAVASELNEPLLYVGENVSHTDIAPAI